jgi:hypothetical protein
MVIKLRKPNVKSPTAATPQPAAIVKPAGPTPAAASSSAQAPHSAKEPKPLPPSRHGKQPITVWVSPEMAKRLKILAVTEETKMQNLLQEAIKLLLASREGHSA